MPLSGPAIRAMTAPATGEVFLACLIIETSKGIERFVNDLADLVIAGVTYRAYPFRVTWLDDDGESMPTARLEIDNVGQELIDEIRSEPAAIEISIRIVLASSPELIEAELEGMSLRDVRYNSGTISGALYYDDILNAKIPGDLYDPIQFAGLHR